MIKKLAQKGFWILVHTSTVLIAVSAYMSLTSPDNLSQNTLVLSASTKAPVSGTIDMSTTMGIVNQYRSDNSLGLLVEDPVLTKMANQRADDMVANQYFAHKNPEGKMFYQLMIEQGTAPDAACENLSLSYSSSTGAPFAGWKDSRGHNACMLDSRMNKAGYATREYGDSYDSGGQLHTHYLVVAIHGS